MGHLLGAGIEAKAGAVAVVVPPPMQHATAVRTLPVVELRVAGAPPLTRRRRWQQRHGALGIRATRQVLHAACRKQRRECPGLSRHIGDLRGRERQPALAREFPGGPHEPRKRLVIEQAGEHVCEQHVPGDFAVANRLQQRVTRVSRPVLEERQHLQRALGGKAKVAIGREPRERGVEISAMNLERSLLQIGVADVGVNRGQPVQRPALRRGEAHAPARDAILSHFDVDLKVGRLGERHPDLAAERGALG